jgi:hypothetical protein
VLTTTPGGAEVIVDPVDVDGVGVAELDAAGVDVGPDVGTGGVVDAPEDSDELSACELPAESEDEDEDDAGDDGESAPGVSAHATLGPVRRTAPTPSATARDPTRPTYAAAFI